MESIIQEIAEKIISDYQENLLETLNEGKDISEFILGFKKTLDHIGAQAVQMALEEINTAVKKDPRRKKSWKIVRNDPKVLTTIFGEVEYTRTYYRNNKSGIYKYLSDEMVGITVHDRMDTSLQAKMIDEAAEQSYHKSAKKAVDSVDFTSQTVMNCIRSLGKLENSTAPVESRKDENVKVLFIEADEDHVSLQDGRNVQPRLVYVHEGYHDEESKRKSLKGTRYFSGLYKDSSVLWEEVSNYIIETYDIDKVERIYLSGDGAKWIKEGLNWIPKCTYVLDYFHLSKYIRKATAHLIEYENILWQDIHSLDKNRVLKTLTKITKETESETKKESVKDTRKYIRNNWEGVVNRYNDDYIGCSAEGHVSHILADRLSSRPKGWCEVGVDQMTRLRAFKANGGNVLKELLKKKREMIGQQKSLEISIRADKIISRSANERINNITVINKGKKTWAYELFRSIKYS